jgi:RNA polymerase sigma-70 factor (ECF subfamily)
MVVDAGAQPSRPAAMAQERLARRYWSPVYAYIRRAGHDVHEAADLTQGFMCDVVIARKLAATADPARGRFRALLLTALRNYLHDRHRMAARQGGGAAGASGGRRLPLDAAEMAAADARSEASPEAAFAAQWGATMLRRVLDEVHQRCLRDGLEAHWILFEARVVRPLFTGEPKRRYSQLVTALNLDDVGQAANMMVTVKRRVARALGREVARTVSDPRDIEQELIELVADLERSS